jgi:hypothetical protein
MSVFRIAVTRRVGMAGQPRGRNPGDFTAFQLQRPTSIGRRFGFTDAEVDARGRGFRCLSLNSQTGEQFRPEAPPPALRVAIQRLMLGLLIFYISLRLNPRGALPLAFEHHFALELTRLASPPFHNPISMSPDYGHGPRCLFIGAPRKIGES